MTASLTQENLRQMASRWLPPSQDAHHFRIHTDTTNFFKVEYGDVVVLGGKPYLVRHNAKEGRFGVDDEVKFWVKRAIDLKNGSLKIIKLVFYEKFTVNIGDIEFECFRRDKMKCSTIVLGRQGLSRSEEFLFGSVSSKIVNHARDCTVWVVE